MFTGIVSDIGEVLEVQKRGDLRARIATKYTLESIDMGASISCNGICLTVVEKGGCNDTETNWFDVELSAETLSKTNVQHDNRPWKPGLKINLERALRLGDELGGHIVSGHVDGLAEVVAITDEGDSTRFSFRAPQELAKFIAPKGSVALNGTSLTVNEVEGDTFGINLISHTKQVTTWGEIKVGDMVNLEIDTLARYVARLNEMGQHEQF